MILIDANILLYAHTEGSQEQERCRKWLLSAFGSAVPVCLSWLTICAFLRITTHPRLLARPLGMKDATAIVEQWVGHPNCVVLQPGDRHWQLLSKLLAGGTVTGAKVMDAHLAALAIEHGATLASADRDFRSFKGLRLVNPLAVAG